MPELWYSLLAFISFIVGGSFGSIFLKHGVSYKWFSDNFDFGFFDEWFDFSDFSFI